MKMVAHTHINRVTIQFIYIVNAIPNTRDSTSAFLNLARLNIFVSL